MNAREASVYKASERWLDGLSKVAPCYNYRQMSKIYGNPDPEPIGLRHFALKVDGRLEWSRYGYQVFLG